MSDTARVKSQTVALSRAMKLGDVASKYLGNFRFEWQTLQTFLIIMGSSEVSMQELEKRTKLTQAAVSRNVAKLAQGLTMDAPGARLIEAFEDPYDRRHKLCKLTKLGEKCAQELTEVLT